MSDAPLLSWVTFAPFAVAAVLLAVESAARLGGRRLPAELWRGAGLAAAVLTFLLSLGLWTGFDPTRTGYQFVEYEAWLPEYGVHYFVGIDGISLLLTLLTTFLMPVVMIASWNDIERSPRSWIFFMLSLETGMVGTFAALNLFQFYLFWELMLIPMYFIIGVWGGARRVYAAVKFFLFTMSGSLLMLVAILVLYVLHHQQFGIWTLDLVQGPGSVVQGLLETAVPTTGVWWQTQTWLFAAFFLAFGVKVPVFPLHTWLPDAHVEAPTAGSVILAGVLLKMGTYGFVRFALPLFPVASVEWTPVILALALVGIVYGSLVAMVQADIKKLVAYSSVAHLGFVMLGMFALNVEGLEGSILQMVNHGISTGALFLLVGMIYERRHTREIAAFGGIAKPMPVYAALFGITVMSSVGLPMLNGFVGEFLILLGAFHAAPGVTAAATFGVVLAAVYLLWMFRRVFFGPVENPENRGLIDLGLREKAVMVAMILPMFWIGIYPDTFLRRLHPPVLDLLHVMEAKSSAQAGPAAERARAKLQLALEAGGAR
jgi:NADH-quinone oxidoreductase subunit M